MLPFHEQIVSELLEEPTGGLVILSSGLSVQTLISSLLLLHTPSQGTLLILSASDAQKSSILVSLPGDHPKPGDIPGDLPPHHRLSLYSTGAAFFVSPRILIADLLTSRAPPSALAGLLLLNAHRVSDTSTEAFVVRVVRSGNPSAYVRAFSDRPQAMVSGFAKAERIMKSLCVRRLHLWPRFQVQVSADLERSPPEVVDVRVPMTGLMVGIQAAVLGAMDACLKELRMTNKVDVEDLTVENGLFKSFDEIVRRQLDPIWHMVGKKTKQLVADLRTLRKLADYLVRYDAVTYLKYLDTLRVSEGVRSVWIFADSSHKIFEFAMKRVYKLVQPDAFKASANRVDVGSKKRRVKEDNKKDRDALTGASPSYPTHGGDGGLSAKGALEEVLEEAPKWKVLRELLEEVEEERQNQRLSEGGEVMTEGNNDDSSIILVVCKDECSCIQLEDCIKKGSKQVMEEEWEKYLLSKAVLPGLRKCSIKKSRDSKGFGVLDGEAPAGPGETSGANVNKLENDALLAAASAINDLAKKETSVGVTSQLHSRKVKRKGMGRKGKRKGMGGNATVKVETPGTDNKIKATEKDLSNISSSGNGGQVSVVDLEDVGGSKEHALFDEYITKDTLQKHTKTSSSLEFTHTKPLPLVHFCALENEQNVLNVIKPSVIVVYHPDMTFVREIEVYKSQNPLKKLKVYFLFYDNSVEVQKFEASIHRENAAFESLIRQKSMMMIPVDQDRRPSGIPSSCEAQSFVSQNSLTRKAGGRKVVEKEMQVIVDMREFMSSLPNVLHQKGLRVIPATLEVGDYVLSPLICVERKSVMDLFQSFASGRLYHQVETMGRFYQIPVLLIEFSQDKSFSFQSAGDIGEDVSSTSIISKLSLLVLHFPRLRLVWSRSVHATAEIFASLKVNQDEPDETSAMRVGVPAVDGTIENDVRAENYNTSAVEFLRRLPGITDSNYRALMDGCKSLAELALLPVERLAELMGGQKAARSLREFLDAKCPTML